MNNENLHDGLDELLKTKFEDHTIVPAEELWGKIAPQISTGMVSFAKYRQMKYAFIGTAVSLVGAVFLLFALNSSFFELKDQKKLLTNKNVEFQQSSNDIAKIKTLTTENQRLNRLISLLKNKATESKIIFRNEDVLNRSLALSILEHKAINQVSVLNTAEHSKTPEPIKLRVNDTTSMQKIVRNEPILTQNTIDTIRIIPEKRTADKPKTNNIEDKPVFEFPRIDLNIANSRTPLSASNGLRNKSSIDFGEFLKRVEIGFSLTPQLSTRTLSQTSNAENTTFDSQYYNSIEKALLTGSSGLDITFQINNDWSLVTGVHASIYRHETQSDALHREVISPNELMLYTSAGKVPIYGASMDALPTQSVFNTNVSQTYIEIPVIARYYWFQNLFLDAGVDYSYLMASKTTINAEEYSGSFTHSEIAGIQKNSFKAIVGAGFDFQIGQRLKLEIGPEVKWQINRMNTTAINSHPLYLGIRTGLRFQLK